MNGSTSIIVTILIAILAITCCVCLCAVLVLGMVVSADSLNINLTPFSSGGDTATTSTPVVVRPTLQPTPLAQATVPVSTPSPRPTRESTLTAEPTDLALTQPAVESMDGSEETLRTLMDTFVPENNVRDLAMRLEGKTDIPLTLEPPAGNFQVGARKQFWVTNVDTNSNFQIQAILRYVTPHVYFWIEDGVRYDERDLRELAETFENDIYPTNRDFFGSEWTPGVDGDPHLYILLAKGLGFSLAGYFSSADEYTPLAHEYSNAHEMFLLNADNIELDDPFTYGVLAHEFQHMIHWYRDRNETSWLNEGFSELAAFLNGYDNGGFDSLYTIDPDLQLNDWPNDSSSTAPHYGASFLFVTYFLDRFSDEATKAVVADPENGFESIDNVLAGLSMTDPITDQPITADDVFFDWVLASYIQDASVGDGRFTYHNYASAPDPFATESFNSCPVGLQTRDVNQYGVDYIEIGCRGSFTLNFEGSVEVGVLAEDPYSGDYAFWSNKGDESNMTLTRSFDFTEETGPLTLSFSTWYDLEEDYDYLYLSASLDGESWQILTTPSGTAEDPSGNSYGWGYNGLSDEGPYWIEEEVDISQFAGEEVFLRFEYVTDAAVNGEGFLLDDVSVPEIGYSTDFEADDGGWEAEGWARIQNRLPQTFRLALIKEGSRGTEVEYISLPEDVTAEIPLTIGSDVRKVTLVVSGTTRFTRQKAAYRFSIE